MTARHARDAAHGQGGGQERGWRHRLRAIACGGALLVSLAACAAQPARDTPDAGVVALEDADAIEADARQAAHEAVAAPDAGEGCHAIGWRIAGRVALSNGREGGSGRIEWRQGDGRYTVTLVAPVTRQGWQLTGGPDGVRLDGLDGGPRESPDAAALLRETTGWDIPVDALGCWLSGVRADEARFGAARTGFGRDLRLARLEQDGWRIDYADWRPVPALRTDLPHRLDVRRDKARVRVVIDQWLAPDTDADGEDPGEPSVEPATGPVGGSTAATPLPHGAGTP